MSTPANDHSVFPLYLDATALHGLAGDIVRTIAPHSEVDPAALLSQPPEACGSVISLSPSMLVGTGRHQLPTQPLLPPADHYRLRRVGDMWDLHYRNKQMWVKNCRGVQLLDYLLHSPHRDC